MKRVTTFLLVTALLGALTVIVSADVPAPGGPFNTAFRVQNMGTGDATCVFSFYDDTGASAYDSGGLTPIPPGDSLYIYVPNDTTVADGSYAGVVSCNQEVAAVVNIGDSNSGATYSGVSGDETATTLYAPGIYDNFYNFYSNVVAQNATSGNIDITLEIYEPGNTTPVYSNTQSSVPASAHVTWEQEGLTELATNQFYSAKIVGTGNVAAIVNIYGKSTSAETLFSYNAFAAGSTTAYAPVVMDNFYGYNTAIVIQNMGSVAADVEVTYSDGVTKTVTIQPGAADSRYTPGEGVTSGALLGATIECTNGQPLAVIVNEQTVYNRAGTYTGFASGSQTVRSPIVMKGYYNWNSSITCQNLSSTTAATMTIAYAGVSGTFDPSAGNPVAAGDVGLFYQPSHITAGSWSGSATISSTEPIVCVVNQDQNLPPYATMSMDQLFVYNAVGE